jgi:amino acid transporter
MSGLYDGLRSTKQEAHPDWRLQPVKRTAHAPKSATWLNVAYWAVTAALIVLGLITFLGAFGSSAEMVSYIIFGMAVALIVTRSMVLRRRARSRD